MPNRIIKESALDSDDLSALTNGAERLFWRLIIVSDDFGRFDAAPQVVKARCFPRLVDKLRTSEIEAWMKELDPKLVRFYDVNGRPYGYFLNWHKHQQRRAERSKFPDPPPEPPPVEPPDIGCNQLQSNVSEIGIRDRDRIRDTSAAGPLLPDSIDQKTWKDFVKMRVRIRKPLTDRAVELVIEKLAEFHAAGDDPNRVLEQSILNSWQGVFPLKERLSNAAGKTTASEPKGFAGIREVLGRQNRT